MNALFAQAQQADSGLSFKVNVGPIMDFFNAIGTFCGNAYSYVTAQPILTWYILGCWVFSFFVVPVKVRSIGSVALSPFWLPFFLLARMFSFVFAAKRGNNNVAMSEHFASSTLRVQETANRLEQVANEVKTVASAIGGKETENFVAQNRKVAQNQVALSQKQDAATQLLRQISGKLEKFDTDSFEDLLDSLELAISNLNEISAATFLSKDNNEAILAEVVDDKTEAKVNLVDMIAEAFKDKRDDFIVALGSVTRPAPNRKSFNYRLGIRLGALRSGEYDQSDIIVLKGDNSVSISPPKTGFNNAGLGQKVERKVPLGNTNKKTQQQLDNDFINELRNL